MKRLPLAATFLLFLLLCISAAYWGLRLFQPPLREVAATVQTRPEAPLASAVGLFGGRSGGFAVASNYQLKGVVAAGGNGSDSVAIISADGKPAQSVRINAELSPGVVVKEVHKLYVLLSEGGLIKRVDLPDASKGTRVDVGGGSPPVPVGGAAVSGANNMPGMAPPGSPGLSMPPAEAPNQVPAPSLPVQQSQPQQAPPPN